MNRQATIERLQTLLQRVQERALVARLSNARQLVDVRGDTAQATGQPTAIATPLRETATAQPLPISPAKEDKTAAPKALIESPALASSSTDQVDPDGWNLAPASTSGPGRVPVKTATDAVAQPPIQVPAKQSSPPDSIVVEAAIPAAHANATTDGSEPLVDKTAAQPPQVADTSIPDAPSSEQDSLTKLGELLAAVAVRSEPVEDLQVASSLTSSADPFACTAPSSRASAKGAATVPGFGAVEETDETASASTDAQAQVVRPPDLLKDQIVAATVEPKAESHRQVESEQVTKRAGSPVPHDVPTPLEDKGSLVATAETDKTEAQPPEQTEFEPPVDVPLAAQDTQADIAAATDTAPAEPPPTRDACDPSKPHIAPPVEVPPATRDAQAIVAATTEVVSEEPPSTCDARQASQPDIAAASESVTPGVGATQKTTRVDEVTVEQQTKPAVATTVESDAAPAAAIPQVQVPVEVHIAGVIVTAPAVNQPHIAVLKGLAQPAKATTFAQAVRRSLALGRPAHP